MKKPAIKILFLSIATVLGSQLICSAFEVGGPAATDVNNWTTNNMAYLQGTNDGFTVNWENVLTNTATANVGNNNFDLTFETDTNYTIGHIFLFDDAVDLSTLAGGIQQMTWTVDFDATEKANWIPVIAVTDEGVINFYRSNNTGNSWNGNSVLNFAGGVVNNSSWVGLNGDPVRGINETRVDGFSPDLQAANGKVQFGFIQWDASTGGIVSPAVDFTTAIDQFVIYINEVQLPTQMLDSVAFEATYYGNEIYDEEMFVNDWAEPGLGGTDVESELNGEILTITNNANNGWVELNNGGTVWENGVAAGGSWTAEVRIRLADEFGNGFVIWAANGIERGIMQINTGTVEPFGLGPLDFSDNTKEFHTFRMAYDSDIGLYFFWRDGVLLTPDGGLARQAPTNQNRFIIGDCCSSYLMTSVEVDYVRFDTTGAYVPGPQIPPAITSIVLDEGTNMVTLDWSSSPGIIYAIDESPDLTDWFEVDDSVIADSDTTSSTFSGPDPPATHRYYRVRFFE